MLWFYAMARIPIAEVTALGFTAPIFTTLGAALFLGERLHLRRIGAVLIAFGGAMIILRPGFQVIEVGALAQLTAAPLFAVSFLLAKKLTETESSASIVSFMSIFVTLALIPLALLDWRTPNLGGVGLAFRDSGPGDAWPLNAHPGFPRHGDHGDPTLFLPAIGVGHTLGAMWPLREEPEFWTLLGGAIIVASVTYIAHREALAQHRARTAKP